MRSAAGDLSRTLGPLRRAVLRATRAKANLPDVSEAYIELIRTLAAEGPLTSAALAQRLQLARSTVSNLVKSMSADGLIERTPTPDDLRSTALGASPSAVRALRRYDTVSSEVISAAMELLSPGDQQAITMATPALGRLTELLTKDT